MDVKPFRGLRPRKDLAARIPSWPYDVISSDEARKLAEDDPYTFLHVIKPEIDLAPDIDPHDDRVYAKARENLLAMQERGWMVRDERPAYYVYRLTAGEHSQVGLMGAAAVQDYLEGRIKKHEHTRPDKEQDRVRLNDALGATPGPIFLTYAPRPGLNEVVDTVVACDPEASFVAPDGVEHTLWVVDDPVACSRIEKEFSEIPATYVADGHHRTAAAARVAAGRAGSARHFLAVHFPADQVRVLDYNRVVRDLGGLDAASFLSRVAEAGFDVRSGWVEKRPPSRGNFGMYLDGGWHLLAALPGIVPTGDVVEQLDISILSRNLLEPVLGIGDPRTDDRIDFVGGSRGMEELEARVDSGRFAVAFALYPTSLEDVMAVADEGRVMPPKSTWFEPKLRSGLVVQLLD